MFAVKYFFLIVYFVGIYRFISCLLVNFMLIIFSFLLGKTFDNRYSASASVIINDLLLVKSKLANVSVLSSTDVDFIDTLCVS